MKLALLDLSYAEPELLDQLGRDPSVVCLTVRPMPGLEGRRTHNPVVPLSNFEELEEHHLELLRPLFDAGAANAGPRLKRAAVSHAGASDHAMFVGSRLYFPLLLDMERLRVEYRVDSLELLTEEADGGRCYQAFQAFAETHHLPFKLTIVHALRRGPLQKLGASLDALAERYHIAGPAVVNKLRANAKRVLLPRRSSGAGARQQRHPRRAGDSFDRLRAALFVYHPKSWRYLLPVHEALLAADHEAVLLSCRLETDQMLDSAGVPYVSIRGGFPKASFLREVDRFYQELPLNPFDDVSARLVAEDGPFRKIIRRLALKTCQIYFDVGEPLTEYYRKHDINVVLGTDSALVAGRCLFRTAEATGVTSMFLQHGALVVAPGLAEYFTNSCRLLWGTSSRDNLLKVHVNHPENIHCIGSPFLERQLALTDEDRRLASAPDAAVLIAFSVPGGFVDDSGFVRAAHEVFDAARELPDTRFVIKPHPGDHTRVWSQLVSGAALPNVTICRERDVYELMKECRILLTMFSTAGAEAIYMDKPVVSINLECVELGLDFLSAGAAYVVNQSGGLVPVLKSILAAGPGEDELAEKRSEFARAFLYREETPAELRILEFLENNREAPNTPRGTAAAALNRFMLLA